MLTKTNITLGLLLVLALSASAEEKLSFSRDVRPILSDNCFQCHGPDPEQREADLRLDNLEGLSSVVEAGDLENSELYRRLVSTDPEVVMPPPSSKKSIVESQRAKIKTWIQQGAKWERHWAFQPIKRPMLPTVADRKWVVNPIDLFVLKQLESKSIQPSPQADSQTLLRRVYLDLLGIVPPPDESNALKSTSYNDSAQSHEQLVERLLANPHFGERWGRHWLDQARYADSDGYAIDGARIMWPYRDWVIKAINADMPFDQFTREQLAGDLLENPTTEQLIASGFHRNTLVNQEGGSDPEQFRNEAVVDRVNTTGAVWLGLTVGCAQCHTHKYDPISQKEYYQLFAYFNSAEDRNSHSPRIRVIPPQHKEEQDLLRNLVEVANKSGDEAKRKEAKKRLTDFEKRFPEAMVMRELEKPRETFVHIRGDFLRHGEKVRPDVPTILSSSPNEGGSRLEFANWLTSPENPLTARVTVNRIWMHYFGKGLVETENDFGIQGNLPSHPKLLDWLAAELIAQDWSLKSIHRLILNSATYRQSSTAREDLRQIDAANRLLARQSRLRVTSEVLRDLALSASGSLNARIGGPSVYPPQPAGVYAFTQNRKNWKTSPGADRFRRGMYTFFYRSAPHPFLSTFDTPNFQTTCTKRLRSNTPLQALTMANDQAVMDAAIAFAERLQSIPKSQKLSFAFRCALGREPTEFESSRLKTLLEQQRAEFLADADAAKTIAGNRPNEIETASWVAVCRVLLNLDEFVTRE